MTAASIYRPLDPSRQQIRLIEVAPFDPRDNSAVIDCKLHVVSLLDQPEFVALSYVWGDPNVTTEILVDGAPFQATVNLAAALRQAVIHAPVHIQPDQDAAWTDVESDDDDGDGDNDIFKYEHDGASARSDGADCPTQLRFWADAICINQEDQGEKNDQIPLMGSIYSGARLVIGSLGHDDEELDLGMQTLEDICRAYMQETLRKQRESSDNNDGQGLPADDGAGSGEFEWLRSLRHLLDHPAAEATARWDAFLYLLFLPYFKRVWIVQEIVKIFRGTRPRFVSAESWFRFRLLDELFLQLSKILLFKKRFARASLGWAAQMLGLHMQATDKRDNVYGMLGISGLGILVDYNKSVGEVYADMVETCVRVGVIDHLDEFLRFAGVGRLGHLPDAPSWTPCPTAGSGQGNIMRKGNADAATGVFGAAPGSAVCRVKYAPGDLELSLRGIRLEEIVRKRDIPSFLEGADDHERLEFIEYVTSWELVTRIQGVSRAEVMIQTLFPGLRKIVPGFEPAPEQESVAGGLGCASSTCSVAASWLLASLTSMLQPWAEGKDGRLPPREYKSDRHKELFGRLVDQLGAVAGDVSKIDAKLVFHFGDLNSHCLFETDGGNIGRGPQGSRPGDVVCVLEGSRLPALLRRDGDRYVHVGLCHIPGLMDGKVASELVAKGDVAVEEFVLV